ncbi:MAG: redox-regulated ATPase YchF [Actinobacteria bacterium]|nr:redox-regulated ATPase YchF [Actinomycetota bacterium]
MQLGLVGLANCGKTSLFNLVTGSGADVAPYAFTTREPNRAVVNIPDPRLDAIADAQDIPRRVEAQVELVDIPGLQSGAGRGEGLGGQALGRLREVDAMIHVVRAFESAAVAHPDERIDAAADAEAVDLELILADRDQAARKAERSAKAAKSGDAVARAEVVALDALIAILDAGRPARHIGDEAALAVAMEMGLLSAKPVIYLVNSDEPGEPPAALAAHAEAQGGRAFALPVGVEVELAAMAPDEATELAAELGFGDQRGADAVLRAAYEMLDLLTFFTGSGPPEARAWPIPRGTTADRAAGKIHSDLERGFIRAEVINWEDLVAAGSFSRAKEAALVRMEGRDYVVHEGDVMQIRFNV